MDYCISPAAQGMAACVSAPAFVLKRLEARVSKLDQERDLRLK